MCKNSWDNYRLMRKKKKKKKKGDEGRKGKKNYTAKRINKAKQAMHNIIAHN